MMVRLRLYFLICTICVLAACQEHKSQVDDSRQIAPPGWKIADVTLTCADEGRCTDATGILLMVVEKNGVTTIDRCTASLYDSNKILTAAHCLEGFTPDEIYFVMVARQGHGNRIFHVAKILTSIFGDPKTFRGPDIAALELQESAGKIAFVHPLEAMPASTGEAVAMVVNSIDGKSISKFRVDAISCKQKENNSLLPVSYHDDPILFPIQDCKLVHGNSGGAIVSASDFLSVMGIQNSILAHNAGYGITNARCFEFPAWPLTNSSCKVITHTMYRDAQ